jgi:hypothetical protein
LKKPFAFKTVSLKSLHVDQEAIPDTGKDTAATRTFPTVAIAGELQVV